MIDGLTEAEELKLWLLDYSISYNRYNGSVYIYSVHDGTVQYGYTSFPNFHTPRQAYNHLMSEISRWKREKNERRVRA